MDDAIRAVERMRLKASNILVAEARLCGTLRVLCDEAGFAGTFAAVQSNLRRLAAEERERGRQTGGWIA
jgi:hypothetical protein